MSRPIYLIFASLALLGCDSTDEEQTILRENIPLQVEQLEIVARDLGFWISYLDNDEIITEDESSRARQFKKQADTWAEVDNYQLPITHSDKIYTTTDRPMRRTYEDNYTLCFWLEENEQVAIDLSVDDPDFNGYVQAIRSNGGFLMISSLGRPGLPASQRGCRLSWLADGARKSVPIKHPAISGYGNQIRLVARNQNELHIYTEDRFEGARVISCIGNDSCFIRPVYSSEEPNISANRDDERNSNSYVDFGSMVGTIRGFFSPTYASISVGADSVVLTYYRKENATDQTWPAQQWGFEYEEARRQFYNTSNTQNRQETFSVSPFGLETVIRQFTVDSLPNKVFGAVTFFARTDNHLLAYEDTVVFVIDAKTNEVVKAINFEHPSNLNTGNYFRIKRATYRDGQLYVAAYSSSGSNSSTMFFKQVTLPL